MKRTFGKALFHCVILIGSSSWQCKSWRLFFPKNFKQGSDNAAFQSSHCEFSVLALKEWAAAEGPDLGFWDIRK